MTKRSAMMIAGGLVASLMAGMVGAARQGERGTVVVVRGVAAPAPSASSVAAVPDREPERGE